MDRLAVKAITTVLVLFLTLSNSLAQNQGAPPLPDSYDLNAGIFSNYIFRGIRRYSGVNLQPSVTLSHPIGKHENILGRLGVVAPLQGERSGENFIETDLSLSYSLIAGPGEVQLGGIWYQYGNDAPKPGNTGEIFMTIALDAVLSPTFALYQDIDETHSRYYEMSFAQDLALPGLLNKVELTPFATFGYSFHNDGDLYGSAGLTHIMIGVSKLFEADEWSIIPELGYVSSHDAHVESAYWGGVEVERRF